MITLTTEQAQQIEEALANIQITGPDADDVLWINLPGNGTTGKAILRVGKEGLIASQCAKLFNEQRTEAIATIRAARAQEQAEQKPVHESLQIAAVALQDIACSSQTNNLLWWQIRAREAQKQIAERLTNSAPAEPVKQEHSGEANEIVREPVAILKSSKANFERQFGKQVFADWIYYDLTYSFENAAPVQQAEQEPVGVVEGSGEWGIAGVLVAGTPIGTKLYASPVRTKDLTDDEIDRIACNVSHKEFARAVIAADREKNK